MTPLPQQMPFASVRSVLGIAPTLLVALHQIVGERFPKSLSWRFEHILDLCLLRIEGKPIILSHRGQIPVLAFSYKMRFMSRSATLR
jgi:hypothetical protein